MRNDQKGEPVKDIRRIKSLIGIDLKQERRIFDVYDKLPFYVSITTGEEYPLSAREVIILINVALEAKNLKRDLKSYARMIQKKRDKYGPIEKVKAHYIR